MGYILCKSFKEKTQISKLEEALENISSNSLVSKNGKTRALRVDMNRSLGRWVAEQDQKPGPPTARPVPWRCITLRLGAAVLTAAFK